MISTRRFVSNAAMILAIGAGIIAARLFLNDRESTLPDFANDVLLTITGLIIGTFPFVVIGSLTSALVRRYLPDDWILNRLSQNVVIRRAILSVLGILIPVCECGNVPMARGLMSKGMRPGDAVVFLLCAPTVNILTIAVTVYAFGDIGVLVASIRIIGTLILAQVSAVLIDKMPSDRILTASFVSSCEIDTPRTLSGSFIHEISSVIPAIMIGSLIAASLQVLVPLDLVGADGSILWVLAGSIYGMVVSLCSNVDSYFALPIMASLGLGATSAFLIAGAAMDIKMIAMLRTTFTTRAVIVMASTSFVVASIIGAVIWYGQ